MQELLIATTNPGKYREIMEILDGLPFDFKFLGDMNIGRVVEDGMTFAENAYKKAKYAFDKTGLLTLAEDSGILVDALREELGIHTRRWGAGPIASDEEWIEHFLKRMENETDRLATFVCSACVILHGARADGRSIEDAFAESSVAEAFEGETSGIITAGLEAPIYPGLPLSSCFLPDGCDKVYAALSVFEKNKISHRGKAMQQVREFLERKFITE